ncbi:Hypothetical predicted protein [Marmota monax]|uniref:Uncharacterized protein n=1 Tax=Marmota monax TaxID=9995 RepID=A0A5E4C3I9_MARMO|nr:hypothetical protein GHT09_013026 [Marmota monax]VTJ76467.1 Hypothetical predicted protein [Marmota monax]
MAAEGTHRVEKSPAPVLATPLRAVPRRLPRSATGRRGLPLAGQLRWWSGDTPPAHRPRQPRLRTLALNREPLEQL